MLTKEMYKIALKLEEIRVVYDLSEDIAFTLYQMCNGDTEKMDDILISMDFIFHDEEDKIIEFFATKI